VNVGFIGVYYYFFYMTKTKSQLLSGRKIYFLVVMFFLSIFFVEIDNSKAQNTYAECINDYGGSASDCAGYPGNPNVPDYSNPITVPDPVNATCDPYTSQSCCENSDNGGYWYGGTCNANAQVDTNNDNAQTQTNCPGVGVWNGLSCVTPVDPSYDDPSTCNKALSQACCENAINKYYWFNNSCHEETQVVYENRTCNAFASQSCCENVINAGSWYDNTCNVDPRGAGNRCSASNACPEGYKCDDFGSCRVDSMFSSTECRNDGDCFRTIGRGYECTGLIVKECTQMPANNNSGGGTSGAMPVATTNTPITLPNGQVAPANTTVNSDGSGQSQDGTQTYPPNTFPVPNPVNDNFTMCAGVVCTDGNGNPINYGPPIVLGSNNSNSHFGDPDFVGPPVPPGAKCGTNFEEINGVCFPTNLNLPDPQGGVAQIISNIFSWLMGLFATFAVLAFVISGIQYFMASGDESMAETAKNNAKNALIGIVVGLSGFIILKAVNAAMTGQSYLF
jgi:hypothetical protein